MHITSIQIIKVERERMFSVHSSHLFYTYNIIIFKCKEKTNVRQIFSESKTISADQQSTKEGMRRKKCEGSLWLTSTSKESKFSLSLCFSASSLKLKLPYFATADSGSYRRDHNDDGKKTTKKKRQGRRKDDSLDGSRKCAPEPSTIPR